MADGAGAHVRTRGVRILQAEPDAPPPPAGGGAAAVIASSPSKAPIVPAAADPAAPAAAPARPAPVAAVGLKAPLAPVGDAAVPAARPPAAVAVASVIKACPRPFSAPDLHGDAAADLRATLGPKLRAGHRVVLDLAAPYAASASAPGGLAPWLAEIQQSGGKVTMARYCERTRSAFGSWIAKFFAGGAGKAYAPARKFDAILHADALDQVVTQIEFVPRGGGAS